MAKTLTFLSIYLFLICATFARVYKDGDYVMGSNALRMIEGFQKTHERLPDSWDDVRKNYSSSDDKYLNQAMARLGFTNPAFEILQDGNPVKVVAMDVMGILYGDSEELSRLLLIMTPEDNTFQVVGMPETRLRALAAASGIDLNTYSGSAGKWKNPAELDDAVVKLLVEKSAKDNDDGTLSKLFNRKKNPENMKIINLLVIAVGIIILAATLLVIKKRA